MWLFAALIILAVNVVLLSDDAIVAESGWLVLLEHFMLRYDASDVLADLDV